MPSAPMRMPCLPSSAASPSRRTAAWRWRSNWWKNTGASVFWPAPAPRRPRPAPWSIRSGTPTSPTRASTGTAFARRCCRPRCIINPGAAVPPRMRASSSNTAPPWSGMSCSLARRRHCCGRPRGRLPQPCRRRTMTRPRPRCVRCAASQRRRRSGDSRAQSWAGHLPQRSPPGLPTRPMAAYRSRCSGAGSTSCRFSSR